MTDSIWTLKTIWKRHKKFEWRAFSKTNTCTDVFFLYLKEQIQITIFREKKSSFYFFFQSVFYTNLLIRLSDRLIEKEANSNVSLNALKNFNVYCIAWRYVSYNQFQNYLKPKKKMIWNNNSLIYATKDMHAYIRVYLFPNWQIYLLCLWRPIAK